MLRLLPIACLIVLLVSCKSAKVLQHIEKQPQYQQSLSGFFLSDAATGKALLSLNADKLFTPASNTKLLTLATCLAWLPNDSIPALAYAYEQDTLRIWGLAYPLLAADESPYNLRIHSILSEWKGTVEVNLHGFQGLPRFGQGWMWDDYPYLFMTERSGLPLYKNALQAWARPEQANSLEPSDTNAQRDFRRINPFDSKPSFVVVRPSTFAKEGTLMRNEFDNRYYLHPNTISGDTFYAPLYSATSMVTQLLEDWTGRSIRYHNKPLPKDWGTRVWKGEQRDSLLKAMMLPSDNFLAEQLLLEAGLFKYDLTDTEAILSRATKELLPFDEGQVAWADASGISHYNLISPQALGNLIHLLYSAYGEDVFLTLFPAGGKSGTIKDWYKGEQGKPFVYAKTGTLRHNHSLSGVLKAKSGRWLAFSFMHNHFRGSSQDYKLAMEKTLALIRDTY